MAAPTPCSEPNPCEDGEPCDRHEEEQAHAAGEHEFCGVTCEVAMPTEPMRNFVIARGYPGTAGALDELLRRARVAGRAEGIREAADALDAQIYDICAYGQDTDLGTVTECTTRLRRLADDTAPPSALRRAHAALAEQAGRDQAAIDRVRKALDDAEWGGPDRHDVITEIRAALDGPPPATAPPRHLAKGTNAEDCPACHGTNPPYPFLCPGPTEEPTP